MKIVATKFDKLALICLIFEQWRYFYFLHTDRPCVAFYHLEVQERLSNLSVENEIRSDLQRRVSPQILINRLILGQNNCIMRSMLGNLQTGLCAHIFHSNNNRTISTVFLMHNLELYFLLEHQRPFNVLLLNLLSTKCSFICLTIVHKNLWMAFESRNL